MRKKQRGVILVSAIFILIVLSLAAAIGVQIANNSANAVQVSLYESQAYYAARAGLEFMAGSIQQVGVCPTGTQPITNSFTALDYTYLEIGSTLTGFSNGNLKGTNAYLHCSLVSTSTENSMTVKIFDLSSMGTIGNEQRILNMTQVLYCSGC